MSLHMCEVAHVSSWLRTDKVAPECNIGRFVTTLMMHTVKRCTSIGVSSGAWYVVAQGSNWGHKSVRINYPGETRLALHVSSS